MFLRKYATGTGSNIGIAINKADGTGFAASADWTPAAGDVKVSIDGGSQANIATLPTYTNGDWIFVFSNAELTGKKISIRIVDTAVKVIEDTGFNIETYGHASAQYIQDLSAATFKATNANGDDLLAAEDSVDTNAFDAAIDPIAEKVDDIQTKNDENNLMLRSHKGRSNG